MTADELRKMLDLFAAALSGVEDWAESHRHIGEAHPQANSDLHGVWVALNSECKQMREAERRP